MTASSQGYIQKLCLCSGGSFRLKSIMGYHKGAAQAYLQIHQASTEPADQAVPWHVQALFAEDNFFISLPPDGLDLGNAFIVVSTTAATYTAGAADIICTVTGS